MTSELEDQINKIFSTSQDTLEQTIDIKTYAQTLIKEVNHQVLCKNSTEFELWLKISSPNNINAVLDELKMVFSHSSFKHRSNDSVSNYIACRIDGKDAVVLQKNQDSERRRFESRRDVIELLKTKNQVIQKEYDEKMTLLQQLALDLQKKRDRELAEVHCRYLKDREEIENKMNTYPKECKNTLDEIQHKLGLLKKCSHGFNYDSTIFNTP